MNHHYTIYTDASTDTTCSGLGVLVRRGEATLERMYVRHTTCDINEAEARALLLGLEWAAHSARSMDAITVYSDSKALVDLLNQGRLFKGMSTKHPSLAADLLRYMQFLLGFCSFRLEWVSRKQNQQADALSRLARLL